MRICSMLVLAITLGLLVGCRAPGVGVDRQEHVKTADWSQMETITVSLDEYSYSPATLVFTKGTPYKLEIKNVGRLKHYFTAGEFFKAIATRKVQSNADGEIKAPYFLALEVFPGRSLDLYFVPVSNGTYALKCTMEGHAAQGMTGTIEIR